MQNHYADVSVHPKTNVPAPVTPLFGREQERAAVVGLLRQADVRLVTLTGAGGSGKTRLGVQVAFDLLGDFPNSVCFVALAPVQEPSLVVATIAQALGVQAPGSQSLLEALQYYLHERKLLLVLDNFEHVSAAALHVAALLAAASYLKVLITSRTVLHLTGEHDFPVLPLALPDLAHLPAVAELANNPAVALFTRQAHASKADFVLTQENATAVAEICHRVDGLPLTIELAAARCKLLSPLALLARWTSSLHVLTGGGRDLPERQQSLRATIDWSYHLLGSQEQTLLRRLAIFVDGWTLEAAAAVCMIDEQLSCPAPLDTLDHIAALVDTSLIQQERQDNGEPRFHMLETIREYALEQLDASGELPILRQLHAQYFVALTEDAESKLSGPDQVRVLNQLEQEHGNLRAALSASKNLLNGAELGLRLAAALSLFWAIRGHTSEGRNWLEYLLAHAALVADSPSLQRVRAAAFWGAATLANYQDDYFRAAACGKESLSISRTIGYLRGIAWAHFILGETNMLQGNSVLAHEHQQEALSLFRALEDARGIEWTLHEMSNTAVLLGDYGQAAIYDAESLAVARHMGNLRGIAINLLTRAMQAQAAGNYQQATRDLKESLVLFWQIDDRQYIPIVLHSLAYIAECQKDYARAEQLYRESLRLYEPLGSRFGLARCLIGLAALAAGRGQFMHAAQLFGTADALHDNLNAFLDPGERASNERSQAQVRTQLGDAAYAAARVKGRAMSLSQALAAPPIQESVEPPPSQSTAADQPPASAAASSSPSVRLGIVPAGLTPRELEVLRLLARGLSYSEIGKQLVISPRTVNRHLDSIYTKLHVTSRHSATLLAIEHGLA
jgi:predicted ATPase/DNA-binding CsgD family transcriptional regulator